MRATWRRILSTIFPGTGKHSSDSRAMELEDLEQRVLDAQVRMHDLEIRTAIQQIRIDEEYGRER